MLRELAKVTGEALLLQTHVCGGAEHRQDASLGLFPLMAQRPQNREPLLGALRAVAILNLHTDSEPQRVMREGDPGISTGR